MYLRQRSEIESRDVNSYSLDETVSIESIDITFRAKVLNGYLKDEVISATQSIDGFIARMQLRLKSVTRSCWYLLTPMNSAGTSWVCPVG